MKDEKIIFNFVKDFTDAPGGRYRKDGDHSGEEFREDFLIPLYYMAKRHDKKLVVDFTGVIGLAPSFFDEAFGYIARYEAKNNSINIYDRIEFIAPKELKDLFSQIFRP